MQHMPHDPEYEFCQWLAYQIMAASCAFFLAVFLLSKPVLSALAPKWWAGLNTANAQGQTLMRTNLTSWLHSFLSGLWCVVGVIHKPDTIYLPRESYDRLLTGVMGFCCGYFIADFLLMLHLRTFLDVKFYLVHVHHVVVITTLYLSCTFNLYTCHYLCLALICEINNVFLHGGKLIRRFGFPESSLFFQVNNVCFYVTFFVFRAAPHTYILYDVVTSPDMFIPWHRMVGLVAMSCFNVMNWSMLFDYIKSRSRGYKGSSATTADVGGNTHNLRASSRKEK